MARNYLVPIDLNGLELLRARVQNLSTTQIDSISSPGVGQIVYDTTVKSLKTYNGSSWVPVGSTLSGSGAPNTTPATTGALYWDSTNNVLYVADGTSSSSDWQPAVPYASTSSDLSTSSSSAGTSLSVARADHTHRHSGTDHGAIKLSDLGGSNAGDISLNSYKLTNVADPTQAQDAATKAYVDATKQGLDVKESVRAATTGNITLTGEQTVDGVSLVSGDRVLVKNQSTGSQNGIYVVDTGSWTRAFDANSSSEVTPGMFTFVEEGTANGDSGWVLTTDAPITLSTTALVFTQFSGAGQVTAGDGLSKTGNTIDIGTASSTRIVVNANDIDLALVTQTNTSGSATTSFVDSITVDSYGRVTGYRTASHSLATTSAAGIASFSSDSFTVTSGAVSIKASGVSNNQLANSSITVTGGTGVTVTDGAPVALGGTVSIAIGQAVATSDAPTFAGLTLTGKLSLANATSSLASLNLGTGTANPTSPASGDFWRNSGDLKFYNGTATKTLAFTDSTITGNAANVTGVVAVANGGTGASTALGARTNLGATTKVTGTNTAGTSTVVNHQLGQWVTVQVFDTSTGDQVECDITNSATDGGTTTIATATSKSAGALTYVIIG